MVHVILVTCLGHVFRSRACLGHVPSSSPVYARTPVVVTWCIPRVDKRTSSQYSDTFHMVAVSYSKLILRDRSELGVGILYIISVFRILYVYTVFLFHGPCALSYLILDGSLRYHIFSLEVCLYVRLIKMYLFWWSSTWTLEIQTLALNYVRMTLISDLWPLTYDLWPLTSDSLMYRQFMPLKRW